MLKGCQNVNFTDFTVVLTTSAAFWPQARGKTGPRDEGFGQIWSYFPSCHQGYAWQRTDFTATVFSCDAVSLLVCQIDRVSLIQAYWWYFCCLFKCRGSFLINDCIFIKPLQMKTGVSLKLKVNLKQTLDKLIKKKKMQSGLCGRHLGSQCGC